MVSIDFKTISSFSILGFYGIGIILIIVSYIYTATIKRMYCSRRGWNIDTAQSTRIFRGFSSIVDLYTDFLLTVNLYLLNNPLWMYVGIFSVSGLFLSWIYGAWFMYKKRKFMKKHFGKVDAEPVLIQNKLVFIIITFLCGFFPAVQLIQSNIFYLRAFGSQFSQRDDWKLEIGRVICIGIFENIPQFIIQIILLHFYDFSLNGNVNNILLLSLGFTCMSLLLALALLLANSLRLKYNDLDDMNSHYFRLKIYPEPRILNKYMYFSHGMFKKIFTNWLMEDHKIGGGYVNGFRFFIDNIYILMKDGSLAICFSIHFAAKDLKSKSFIEYRDNVIKRMKRIVYPRQDDSFLMVPKLHLQNNTRNVQPKLAHLNRISDSIEIQGRLDV